MTDYVVPTEEMIRKYVELIQARLDIARRAGQPVLFELDSGVREVPTWAGDETVRHEPDGSWCITLRARRKLGI